MKIGFFDSGIGGLTVLKKALEMLPEADYVYYSDNLHVPYGTKPKEEVYGYVEDVVKFLIEQEVEAIVIACNTATSVAVKRLREKYSLPIIGMEPAVKLALDTCKSGKVLATATPLALKEEKFRSLVEHIDQDHRIVSLGLPELVMYAEDRNFDEAELTAYFNEKFKDFDLSTFSGVVLGCTHFVYFRKILEKILPKNVKVFDGNEGTVRHLKECVLPECQERQTGRVPKIDFYYSGKKCEDVAFLNSFLKLV